MTSNARADTKADLKFLADAGAPGVYIASKGGGDQTQHLGNYVNQTVPIRDARVELSETSLDREGFMLVRQPSQVSDFYDDDQVDTLYCTELVTLLTTVTKANRVDVFDNTRRSASLMQQQQRGVREPASIVHNDYSADSGWQRLRDHFATQPEVVESLVARPFAIINTWRSIAGPVLDQPLVFADASSIEESDLVAVERRAENRIGELQVAVYNDNQRWYYYPEMRSDEVLVFKTFDSREDGRARFTPHSAFSHPSANSETPPRESIESRCLVFF